MPEAVFSAAHMETSQLKSPLQPTQGQYWSPGTQPWPVLVGKWMWVCMDHWEIPAGWALWSNASLSTGQTEWFTASDYGTTAETFTQEKTSGDWCLLKLVDLIYLSSSFRCNASIICFYPCNKKENKNNHSVMTEKPKGDKIGQFNMKVALM